MLYNILQNKATTDNDDNTPPQRRRRRRCFCCNSRLTIVTEEYIGKWERLLLVETSKWKKTNWNGCAIHQEINFMGDLGKPVLFQQRFEDRLINVVCSKCGTQLPSVDYQLAVINDPTFLCKVYSESVCHSPLLSSAIREIENTNGPCRCLNGCGNIYCSESCRARAVLDGHNLLCVGPVGNRIFRLPSVEFRITPSRC